MRDYNPEEMFQVTPRERRVSRNIHNTESVGENLVTPRERRVSRNIHVLVYNEDS